MKYEVGSRQYEWPNGARMALSVVVNVEEGAEANIRDGDKYPEPVDEMGLAIKRPIRNYANESNYLYGMTRGAPRVMRLLDKYQVPATFTACALALERTPELAGEIVRQGRHEVTSHGYRWAHQFQMNEEQEREYIRKAVASIRKTTGQTPKGWLSRYLLTDNTRRLLCEEGFLYHMDDYGDDEPRWDSVDGKPIIIMPYQIDTNDMKMWAAPAYTPDQWLKYAIDNLDWMIEEGRTDVGMMSLGLHLRIIGRAGRIWALDRFLAHAAERASEGKVWLATREQIASHFAHAVPWRA